jgi:hypothetical protein
MRKILLLFLTLAALGCGYSRPKQMTQPGIMPVITQLNPSSAIHGGSDFTLEVAGSNFNANAVVNWNGAPRTNKEAPTANKLHAVLVRPSIWRSQSGMNAVHAERCTGMPALCLGRLN